MTSEPDDKAGDPFGRHESSSAGGSGSEGSRADAGARSDATRLGKSLASIELMTGEDFKTVADLNQQDTGKILGALEAKGVITPFQRARLAEGNVDALQMDEYVILDRIGVGGMGEVFKARNRSLDRIEAIKTMNAGHDPSSSVSQRFHREAKILARVEHPSIVPIYKVGHALGVDYIAMKYIEGVNLKDKIDQAAHMGQPITVSQAVDWVSQAASALEKAHEASVIHRDIKPGNLMVTPDGRLFLLDLGIARLATPTTVDTRITRQASALGTPEYMPPEQWADASAVTPETDIYALGCTLFHLLAGRPPFVGDKLSDVMQGHTSQAPPAITSFRPDIPPELEQILAKMLAKDPEDRFRRAKEVVTALEKVPIDREWGTMARPIHRPAEPTRVAVSSTPRPRRQGSWVGWSAVLALLAGIATAGVWFGIRKENQPAASDLSEPKKIVASSPAPSVKPTPPQEPPPAPLEPAEPSLPDWVERYALQNALEWGDSRDIQEVARKANGGQVPTELSDSIRQELDAQTTRRRASRVDTLMAELLASLPESSRSAWPDRKELAEFVESLRSFDSVSSIADLHSERDAIEAESRRLTEPFEGIRLERAGEEWAQKSAESATKALRQMMVLHASPPTLEGFEAVFLDAESRPIDKTDTRTPVTLAYQSRRPVYLTVVQWDDQGLTTFALSKENAATDRWKPLSTIRFDLPGTKTLALYATDAPYFEESVSRVDGEKIPLAEVFSSPRIEPRLRQAFEKGTPLPGSTTPSADRSWNRTLLSIEVVPGRP